MLRHNCERNMFSPSTGDVFFKATHLAQRSGASEIGIDILLAALDAPAVSSQPPETADPDCSGGFLNSDWIPISTEVARALEPFGGFENITRDTLRTALLSVKKNGPDTN